MKNIIGTLLVCSIAVAAQANGFKSSGKVLLTGGVTQIEGAGGGGITPWALIGGYETEDEIGASVFNTNVKTQDFSLEANGVLIGLYDRVEISYARQNFNTQKFGADVAGAAATTFNSRLKQDIYGIKVKIIGDALLEQDSYLPQISIGILRKQNLEDDTQKAVGLTLGKAIGAKDDSGTDIYISATKIILDQSLLLNVTLRNTRANQMGLLGFGGNKEDNAKTMFEFSGAYLLSQHLALGAEYRQKPDNLKPALGLTLKEDAYQDVFLAWAPTKNISLTVAYADLGSIVSDNTPTLLQSKQTGMYSSLQIGF